MNDDLKVVLENRKWRLNNLYWITNEDGILTRFILRPEQEEILDNIWTRNDILKARQLGISTFTAILILDLCLFNDHYRAGIIDRGMDEAVDKLDKIKLAYDMLDHVPDNPSEIDMAIAEIGAELKASRKIVKNNERYITFSNRSMVKVGVTMRGRTLQFLHISELGYVAAHFPKRAKEIKTGAMNSVSPTCCIIKESTHEGGKLGINYEFTKAAMDCVGKKLNKAEYRFFFFPWWESPKYEIHGEAPRLDDYLTNYFAELENKGIVLSEPKKAWYATQWRQNGFDMFQEYPSVPEEALNVPMEGAIYGYAMSSLRAKGYLNCDFEHDRILPLYSFWDLGLDDSTAIWLAQKSGNRLNIIDHYQANDFATDQYIAKIREWTNKYGPMAAHILPHDAATRNKTDAKTYADVLREAHIGKISIVRRTPDTWLGINETRMLLPNCRFHSRCSERIKEGGVEYPSGVECLENYHKKANGQIDHDIYSHSADAFRMIAEAREQGLLEGIQARRKPALARTGAGAMRVPRRY